MRRVRQLMTAAVAEEEPPFRGLPFRSATTATLAR